jgi:hypothetical protein
MKKKLLLAILLLSEGLLMSQLQQVKAQTPRKFYTLAVFVAFPEYRGFNRPGSQYYTTLSKFMTKINDTRTGSYSPVSLFRDFSYGRLDYEFKIFPNSNTADTIEYYMYPHSVKYVMQYNAVTNPIGYSYTDKNGVTYTNPNPLYSASFEDRRSEFYQGAVQFVKDHLPPGEQLDGDDDGTLDNFLFLMLDDTEQPFGATSWNYGISGSPTFNGLRMNLTSQAGGVMVDSKDKPFGVIVHEVGHCMSKVSTMIPDEYDSSPIYRGDVGPTCKGTPAGHSKYMYNSYGQFVQGNEIRIISKPGTYTINNAYSATPDNCYYRINSPFSSTEFFSLAYHGPSIYQKEQEGLFIDRITPGIRGNAWTEGVLPAEEFFLRPFGNPSAACMLNRDVTEFSDPALVLSDRTPAGFRIKNIRKEGTQLKFDVEYTDTKPFIDVLDTVDVINSGITTIEWPVTVNPANARAWSVQGGNTSWLTYVVDYDRQVLRITSTANTTAAQRNATFRVYVGGTTLVDWAYLVQRPANNGNVIWAPKVVNGTLTIDGTEGMRSFRLIGDIANRPLSIEKLTKPTEVGNNKTMKIGNDVDVRYLPTRELSFFAYSNKTTQNITAAASYKNKAGAVTNFNIVQTPATRPDSIYWTRPFPVANDGKWYILESEKSTKVFGNYLQPIREGANTVLGVDVFTPSDSLYWTFETNAAGRVVVRNKALGYLDFDLLASNLLKFKPTKPLVGATMWKGETSNGSHIPSISLYGDTTATFKGLRYTDIANAFKIGYNSFKLLDRETRFQFTEKTFDALFTLTHETAAMVRIGDKIGETTELKEEDFFVNLNLIQKNYSSLVNPTEVQTDDAIKALWAARTTLLNSINKVQTSTAAAPVWYRINSYKNHWTIVKQAYLCSNGTTALLYTENMTDIDNFLFRFESVGNGKVRIVSKKYPTFALRAGQKWDGGYTFSTTRDIYNEFQLVDYPGSEGVKKLIVGNTLNATHPSYMLHQYNTDIIRNDLWQQLRRGENYGGKTNTFEIEAVATSVSAAESVIAEHSIIRVVDGRVLVDGTDKVEIFNIYGVKMPLNQRLVTGVYIVVVANQAQKILVR